MNFNTAELLSYNHETKIKDAGFRFGTVKHLSIRCGLDERSFPLSGFERLWSGIEYIDLTAHDYEPVIINGYNFGSGKVISITANTDADGGRDVRRKKYEVELEVYGSGNFDNLMTAYYSGVDYSKFYPLEDFDETFSASQGEDGIIEFEHAISIQFVQTPFNNPIQMARDVAEDLFGQTNLTGFLFNYPSIPNLKRRFSENYNLIDKQCNFSERSRFDTGNLLTSYTHSVQTSEDGITTVTEDGSIEGNDGFSGFDLLQSEFNAQKLNFYNRASGVYNFYLPNSTLQLKKYPTEARSTINKWTPSLSYGWTFTNDPSIGDGYTWEYTLNYDQNDNNIVNVIEDGSVIGYGLDGYYRAKTIFSNTIESGIAPRVSGFYYENFSGSETLSQIEKSDSFSEFARTRGYSRTFTDDDSYDGLYIIKKQIEDADPVHLTQTISVVGHKEVIQPQNQSTQGIRNISISVSGPKNSSMQQLLNIAKSEVELPSGNDVYLNSASFTHNPFKYSVDLDAKYAYHRPWPFTQLI